MVLNNSCQYADQCLNGHRCFSCQDYSLLKLPKRKRGTLGRNRKEDKSWKQLEQDVANKLASFDYISFQSRRQKGSGNIWFRPGDVVDDVVLPECKERTIEARGKQSFAIQKEWLDKIAQEADGTGKYPCLCFRYQGDSRIFTVWDLNVLIDLIYEVKFLRQENQRLKEIVNQIKFLRQEQELLESKQRREGDERKKGEG